MRHVVEQYLSAQWTQDDVDNAAVFYATHNSGFSEYPFPRELFEKVVRENNGYFPVRVDALPDGTVVHARTPVYQITASGEYSHLVTFLETLLTHIWYPTCVATLARRLRTAIQNAFDESAETAAHAQIPSAVIDLGMRYVWIPVPWPVVVRCLSLSECECVY